MFETSFPGHHFEKIGLKKNVSKAYRPPSTKQMLTRIWSVIAFLGLTIMSRIFPPVRNLPETSFLVYIDAKFSKICAALVLPYCELFSARDTPNQKVPNHVTIPN